MTSRLPQDYFRLPSLRERERKYFIRKARDLANELIQTTRTSSGRIGWMEAGVKNHVQLYEGVHKGHESSADELVRYLCGATRIQATLDECVDFFDMSTTKKARARSMYDSTIVDSIVLYSLIDPSEATEYQEQINMKWSAMNIQSSGTNVIADFVTLECQDTFKDPITGRKGWVRAYHSIKLPAVPDLERKFDFVRAGYYSSGYVMIESQHDGFIDAIYSCGISLKGNVDTRVFSNFALQRVISLGSLDTIIRARQNGVRTRFLHDYELLPKDTRSRCFVCQVKFSLMVRKTRCRYCGEVVCHRCTRYTSPPGMKHTSEKARVCNHCVGKIKMVQSRRSHSARTSTPMSIACSEHSSDSSSVSSYEKHATTSMAATEVYKNQQRVKHSPQHSRPRRSDSRAMDMWYRTRRAMSFEDDDGESVGPDQSYPKDRKYASLTPTLASVREIHGYHASVRKKADRNLRSTNGTYTSSMDFGASKGTDLMTSQLTTQIKMDELNEDDSDNESVGSQDVDSFKGPIPGVVKSIPKGGREMTEYTKAISDNFGKLVRPIDAQTNIESELESEFSADMKMTTSDTSGSLQDLIEEDDFDDLIEGRMARNSKISREIADGDSRQAVEVYQKLLQLVNRQRELDRESYDYAREKELVEREIDDLYKQLDEMDIANGAV